jgi:hypothetical protein
MAIFKRDPVKTSIRRAIRLESNHDMEGAARELYKAAGKSEDYMEKLELAMGSSEKAESAAREARFLLKAAGRGADIHERYDAIATQLRCFRLAAEAAELAGDVGRAMEMRKSLAGVPSFSLVRNGVDLRVSDAKARLRR